MYIPDYFVAIPVQLPSAVDAFRQQYDPKSKVNEAHITLVVPFSAKIMSPELATHISTVVAQSKQFSIVAEQFHITDEGYVFYIFDAQSVMLLSDLHERLCEHPLFAAQLTHRPFLPHITIGKFVSREAVPQDVLQRLETICVPHRCIVDKVRLYEVVDPQEKRVVVADYFLQ